MADDNNYRTYRGNDGYARQPAKSPSGNDPLAELARLIGQTDPFAEFGKPQRAGAQPAAAPQWSEQPQNYAAPPVAPTQPYAAPGYETAADYGRQGYDAAQPAPGYDDAGAYYQDEAAEDGYDDAPPRRRLVVIAIAAVLGLAVVGTAGAFGYRALFAKTGSTPPPVIKADTAPSKVVPPSKSEPQTNKLIYDRVGERNSGEKLVSREEQPIDVGKPAQQPLLPNAAGAPAAAATIAPPGSVGAAPVDAPKKVHTIVIRPDQPQGTSDAPPAAASAAVPPPPAAAVAPPSRPAPAPKPAPAAPQRLASAPPVTTADAENLPPPRPTRAAQAQPTSAPRNAPLSLSPNAAPPAVPRAEPTRTASAPVRAPVAPRSAAPPPMGQYAVQVSSQRSEAEAEAAYRSLQGKYPTQLGSRPPIIRRADLGSKGIYFRAMAGPFASAGEANSLCQSLRSAGGSCLIQKN